MALKVSDYLATLIDAATDHGGMNQRQIAQAIGYEKPNMISMIKTGATRLPVSKIPVFAKTVGVDPVHLLRILLSDYMPETWNVIQALQGNQLLSESEVAFVEQLRTLSDGVPLIPTTAEEKAAFAALVKRMKNRALQKK